MSDSTLYDAEVHFQAATDTGHKLHVGTQYPSFRAPPRKGDSLYFFPGNVCLSDLARCYFDHTREAGLAWAPEPEITQVKWTPILEGEERPLSDFFLRAEIHDGLAADLVQAEHLRTFVEEITPEPDDGEEGLSPQFEHALDEDDLVLRTAMSTRPTLTSPAFIQHLDNEGEALCEFMHGPGEAALRTLLERLGNRFEHVEEVDIDEIYRAHRKSMREGFLDASRRQTAMPWGEVEG